MPQYSEALASDRPGQGYEGHPARRVRLEHQALAHVFYDFDERTTKPRKVCWGGTVERKTQIYLAAVVVDHLQLDKYTGCPGEYIYCTEFRYIVQYCVIMTCFQLDATVAPAPRRSF